jgi:hypothetical protein
MTLSPKEVKRMARRQLDTGGYPLLDWALVGYWRLIYNQPNLDLDDARAVVAEHLRLHPAGRAEHLWDVLTRAKENFWRRAT